MEGRSRERLYPVNREARFMQHHVVIAYSRQDPVIMRKVQASLAAAGLIVWTDKRLVPGSEAC